MDPVSQEDWCQCFSNKKKIIPNWEIWKIAEAIIQSTGSRIRAPTQDTPLLSLSLHMQHKEIHRST